MKDLPTMNAIRELTAKLKDRSDPDRRTLIAIGLGRAISYHLPLPSMPVNSISQHYDVNCDQQVKAFVSRINELYPLDHQTVRTIGKALYTFRYNLAYDPYTLSEALDRLAAMQTEVIPAAFRPMINSITSSQELIDLLGMVMNVFQCQVDSLVDKEEPVNPLA